MAENDQESEENQQELHFYWRQLATAKFKHKFFVKSSGTEDDRNEITKKHENPIEISESASAVYQEILEMPSSAPIEKKSKVVPKKRVKIEKVPFDKEVLFRLATNDDEDGIKKLLDTSINIDINAKDAYGWTGLMMSACEGSINSFRILLDVGSDLTIKDRAGNTAKSLAKKKNHSEILELIEAYNRNQAYDDESSENEDDDDEKQFCPDCKIEISKQSSKSHQTSTVHLFSCKYNTNASIKSFGISHSNKGFKLMKTIGWDGKSALGAQKNGKLYPVKTVIRKGRSGLGVEQGDAKITHFEAHDVRAVMHKAQPRALSRKEILKNHMNDKKRDQILRREHS